jgi:GR25 family glycosyltransferase involved in LPS biosynthesis
MVDKFSVRVINLDRSKDRWSFIRNWNHSFTDFDRFEATDGRKLDYINDDRVSLRTKLAVKGKVKRAFADIDTVGALACSISHHNAMQDFYSNSNKDYLIIFEDDINYDKFKNKGNNYSKQLLEEFNKLPSDDWDIWLLGMQSSRKGFSTCTDYEQWIPGLTSQINPSVKLTNPFSFSLQSDPEYADVKSFLGCHAILFKREAIPKILKNFYPIEAHYDAYLSYLAQKGDIRIIYKPSFHLDQNNNFMSDINSRTVNVGLLNQEDV